jgi:rhodanese-related sulfurtransferase
MKKLNLKRICLEACVMVAFGVIVGLTLNHQLVMDAFSGNLAPEQCQTEDGEVQASSVIPLPAMLDDVQLAAEFDVLIVDARTSDIYERSHILGAVNLPMMDVEELLPDFMERFPKDRSIIAYCSGFGCPDSFDLGMRLLEEGYQDVRVFEGGYPEWSDAGLPVTGESR